MREIDYDKVRRNVDEMINTLEHDATRSAGKVKQAAVDLVALYELKDRYDSMKKKPGPKPIAQKEG